MQDVAPNGAACGNRRAYLARFAVIRYHRAPDCSLSDETTSSFLRRFYVSKISQLLTTTTEKKEGKEIGSNICAKTSSLKNTCKKKTYRRNSVARYQIFYEKVVLQRNF